MAPIYPLTALANAIKLVITILYKGWYRIYLGGFEPDGGESGGTVYYEYVSHGAEGVADDDECKALVDEQSEGHTDYIQHTIDRYLS